MINCMVFEGPTKPVPRSAFENDAASGPDRIAAEPNCGFARHSRFTIPHHCTPALEPFVFSILVGAENIPDRVVTVPGIDAQRQTAGRKPVSHRKRLPQAMRDMV